MYIHPKVTSRFMEDIRTYTSEIPLYFNSTFIYTSDDNPLIKKSIYERYCSTKEYKDCRVSVTLCLN